MRIAAFTLLAAGIVTLAGCSGGSATKFQSASAGTASGTARYIVMLTPGAAHAAVTSGLSHRPTHSYTHAINGFAAELTATEVQALRRNPQVVLVEEDLPVQLTAPGGNGKGKGGGGGGSEPPPDDGGTPPPPDDGGETPPPPPPDDTVYTDTLAWGVNKIDAELNARWLDNTAGWGVTVAVLDTGMDLDHPDLAGAIVASVDYSGKGSAEDGHGHGTHVAGIIGARKNNIGYIGVAPACSLAAVKVMSDTGSGYISWIVSGLNWAMQNKAAHNIRVVNMSIGSSGTSSTLETAVNNATAAGIICVAGAGNSFSDANTFIPAKYDNVLCVSALTSSGSFASYSNWGPAVDLIAPGSSIPSLNKDGGYTTKSGTSMASPHVAGAVALWCDDHTGGFSEAKAALLAAGKAGPWPGDPDGIAEPMVYARDL